MSMRLRGERGATAVIVAGSLIMIMGIAAIAIDGGQAFSERRQAQTGVDFAALGALQAAKSCMGSSCSETAAADSGALEARAIVSQNLPGRALDWASCTDPGRDNSRFVRVATTTDCVSFTYNFDEARVVVPDDTLDTSFGGAIGQPTITVNAEAQAGQQIDSSARIVPFALSPGPHFCMWENQAPQSTPPCTGPGTGNFGVLDIFVYGNPQFGTTENCSGGAGPRIQTNLALGSDHILGTYAPGDTIVNDQAACPNLAETPNEVEVQPGAGVSSDVSRGLVENGNARLRCSAGSVDCLRIRGIRLDNTGLWEYLLPGACSPTPTTRSEMETCLSSWTGGVIFSEDIADNRRFVAVPVLPTFPSNGFGYHLIDEFRAVYIETIYAGNCTGGPTGTCELIFSPGESPSNVPCPGPPTGVAACGYSAGGNWNGNRNVEAVTGFALDPGMLPLLITETFPGTLTQREFALTE